MKEEIDLLELAKLLLRKRLIILAAMLLAVILATVYTFGFMEDEYSATTSLYVLNQTNSDNITSSDVSVSTNLVNDYREIIMSNRIGAIAVTLAKQLNIPNIKALKLFYESKTCALLHDKSTGLYLYGDLFIADEFLREMTNKY